ncbi:unnamed protein product [Candidula unifasciata]|uniref:Uncharacterized protein n=1 Tax=Candidula unifasciata TaxID=100452 RepID=A0A8S3Z8B2_9EUPU|nr:unnamed protein product [Candidula unifasciata]
MDDSFDELVPDNWLELPSKRKLEEPAGASISSYKHPRLSASSSNDISVTLSSRTCDSHDSDNSDGTNEDTSVNEPDFTHIEHSCDPLEVQKSAVINGNNHSDDDVFSRMTQTGYSSHASENGIVYGGSSSELHMKKCLTNNLDSRILSCLSTVDSKDVVDIGDEQISREGEPGCSKPEPSPLRPGSPKEPSSPETVSRLKSISSLVTDARVIADIVPNKDFSTIYELLLEHRDKDDRLDIVTFQLTNSDSAVTVSAVDIFEEVRLVSQAVPSADVNEIYALLEQLPPSSSRVQDVITKVKPSIPTESSAQEQISLVETRG